MVKPHYPLSSGECPLTECEFNQLGICSRSDSAADVPFSCVAGPK